MEYIMKKLLYWAVIALFFTLPWAVHANDSVTTTKSTALNPELAVITAFYELLSSHDDITLAERAAPVIDMNWLDVPESIGGQGLDGFVRTFTAFHQMIPDMKWTVKHIYKSGHTYTVRCIGSGTPVADFLGLGANWIPGNRFNIMSIDIHTVKDGKIVKSFHIEDWREAMRQLSAN